MRGFDLDGGAFFMCTETSPRCFIIQQVSDVDGALKEVQQSGVAAPTEDAAAETARQPDNGPSPGGGCSPFLPMLPWWFTAECRQQLLNVPPPLDQDHHRAATPDTRPPSSIGPQPLTQEQLRERLKHQLEYYFSRENLINDRYLRCQMDADQYVPIKIVANFPKVTQLTTDLELIVDVLKSSAQVQVDDSGHKVRPVSKRCTIILREIPEHADENEVKEMFAGDGCPPYQSLSYGLNDSWYVTFANEQDTQKAFFHLQTLGKTFNGKPVFARIKTGGAPIGADVHTHNTEGGHIHLSGSNIRGQLIVHHANEEQRMTPSPNGGAVGVAEKGASAAVTASFDLGQILAQCGYVPRATFRPHMPAPAPMPPLQPTTMPMAASGAAALPQAAATMFAQPILHNGFDFDPFFFAHHQHPALANGFHRPRRSLPFPARRAPLRISTPPPEDSDDEVAALTERNQPNGACCGVEHQNGNSANARQEEEGGTDTVTDEQQSCSEHSIPVGQNEYILRQRAKEGNRPRNTSEIVRALLPSPVPRITDVPRMNGKGDSGVASKKAGGATSVLREEPAPPHRRCYSPPPGQGGATFVGFQRQESVEAYQIAMAANGVGSRQRRQQQQQQEREREPQQHSEGREEPRSSARTPRWQQHGNGGRTNLSAHKVASSGGGNNRASADIFSDPQQQPPRILGSGAPRRSVEAPQPLRPFGADSASSTTNWRQNSVSSSTATNTTATLKEKNGGCRTTMQQNGAAAQWQHHPLQPQQQQQHGGAVTTRLQPLLSLASVFQPAHQQQQSCASSMRGASAGGGSRGGRGSGYRLRTWTTDWQARGPQNSGGGSGGAGYARDRGRGDGGREGGRDEWQQVRTLKRGKRSIDYEDHQQYCAAGPLPPQHQNSFNNAHHHSSSRDYYHQGNGFRHAHELNNAASGPTCGGRLDFRETGDHHQHRREYHLQQEAPPRDAKKAQPSGYNFVEREFPALLGGEGNDGTAAAAPTGDQHSEGGVCGNNAGSDNGGSGGANANNAGGLCASTASSTTPALQLPQHSSTLPFSAVVAGHGRRRATIGAGTTGGEKKTGESGGAGDTLLQVDDKQQRSGTVTARTRSYAQIILLKNNASAAKCTNTKEAVPVGSGATADA